MRLFYFLARYISYTFAYAFFAVFVSWIVVGFGFFLGSSFIFFSYDRFLSLIFRLLPLALLISAVFLYLFYGFLTPIKIPAFLRPLRIVNSGFKKKYKVTDEEIFRIFRSFSDFPMYNLILSVIYVIMLGVIVLGLAFYEFKFAGTLTFVEIIGFGKIVGLSVVITSILNGMGNYLLTEVMTSDERGIVYNELLKRGIRIKPLALIGIRMKFFFFVILMNITLLSFAAFLEKMRYDEESNFLSVITYLVISILSGYILMQINTGSILRLLVDLRRFTTDVAKGNRSGLRVIALEKEFADIEYALMEMAWEIDGHRRNLEDKVEQRTMELQTALADLKLRDDQMQKQLDMASIIQQSILPGKIDDWNELKFAVRYNAMEKIGGDFYDIYQLKDDKIGILIADVSGHGIPAALVTTMAKISFGNAGNTFESPRRIFQEVNQNIHDHVKTQDYMTCFMVAIDEEYQVVYSNASHQKAILLRTEKEELELLDTGGLFIGAISEARDSYEEKTTQLEYGDRIILYTDGIPEAINQERKEYTNKRFEKIIFDNRKLPLEKLADAIIDDVQNHLGSLQAEDDITLIIIELARDEAISIIKEAKNLLNSHMYYEAVKQLEDGLKKYPENQKIIYNLAKNYFRVNNYSRAAQMIETYVKKDKRNKYAFYIGGAAYYQILDYDNSVDFFKRAIDIDPNFVDALFALAMTFKKKGESEEAIKTFEKIVNIDPDNRMALFELKRLR